MKWLKGLNEFAQGLNEFVQMKLFKGLTVFVKKFEMKILREIT